MGKNNWCLLTNDVETHSIWHNKLLDRTGVRVYKEIMPRLLDLYEHFNVKSTFFYTGYIAKLIPDIVKMIVDKGHEVGCHGLVHDVDKAFDILSLEEQTNHLIRAKTLLEQISGNEVISFRAPALRVNKNTPIALSRAGFKIDSSISPQRLDFLVSFGSYDKFQRIFSPRSPYLTKSNNLAKRGDGPIVEIPLSSFILPLVGSTMRSMPVLNSVLRSLLSWESMSKNSPIVYYMHPNEFLNEKGEIINGVERRTKNIIKYLLADKLRRKIKIKNLGDKAFDIYSKQINFFAKKGYKFITIKEYSQIHKLID
jgi:peptidoglycan/xylan/chitin deacetylase (PgdA/CDA1 family)